MNKRDRFWMTVMAIGGFSILWFFWFQSITDTDPLDNTGGFVLVFFTPLLAIGTIGAIYHVGKAWLEKLP
jgi:DMSO reductase anchor subunit